MVIIAIIIIVLNRGGYTVACKWSLKIWGSKPETKIGLNMCESGDIKLRRKMQLSRGSGCSFETRVNDLGAIFAGLGQY